MKFECTVPKILRSIAAKYPEVTAQLSHDKDGSYKETNFHDMYQSALDFGGALLELGVKREYKIGLIADNRAEWEHADIGLLAIGAIDVPRGCDATERDLTLILSFAGCEMVITENTAQVKKILNIQSQLPQLKTVIAFDEVDAEQKDRAKELGVQLYQFQELKKSGHEWRKRHIDAVEDELEKGQWDDLATIIFTSGTTGTPKGVMLTHGNFITQLDEVTERIFLNPGERGLCCLPVWHAFQREVEYVILSQAATICYSKPLGSILLADMKNLNPTLLPAVPRVFEAIYDG
ncbi:MAG: AMP-binding protein, partial [Treponema sp.]|nr:AMP-binding protein [Treponema sp.]